VTYDVPKPLSRAVKNVNTVAYRIHGTSTTTPAKEIFGDYVYLQAGRAWVVAVFADATKPFDASLERHVLELIGSRMLR
jgi:hypothetical protein